MYNNYIFDLYGTLIDINTDEWNDDLWKKIAILYAYKGAHYTYDELNEEYDRLVQAEKKAVLKKSPDTKVVDIKIEKVFRKLFTQKGVKVTKAEVFFIAEAFRCYSTKYIKLYDGVLDLLDTLKAKGKKIYLLSNAQRSFTENELNMFDLTKYFDGICISSDEECSKPDEKYFKTLFDRYGLEKSESIMIGNDYISDIGGAADFGIDSLYIHQSISPDIDGELRSTYKVMDGEAQYTINTEHKADSLSVYKGTVAILDGNVVYGYNQKGDLLYSTNSGTGSKKIVLASDYTAYILSVNQIRFIDLDNVSSDDTAQTSKQE